MKRLLLAATIALPMTGFAQDGGNSSRPELSYSYGELRYLDTDGGGDGLRLRGSYALQDNWLIVGGLTSIDLRRNVDVTTIQVGAGYVFDLDSGMDLVGTLEFVNTDVDTPFGGGDDNGFELAAGARGMVTDQLELRAMVHHVNLDNNDTFIEAAGDYYFSDKLSAGASLEFAGDVDIFSIGVRLYFGR